MTSAIQGRAPLKPHHSEVGFQLKYLIKQVSSSFDLPHQMIFCGSS